MPIGTGAAMGLMAGGSAIGGLGGLAGLFADTPDPQYVTTDPYRDPLFAANALNALTLQGQGGLFGGGVMQQASPLNQLAERIMRTPGYDNEDKIHAIEGISAAMRGERPRPGTAVGDLYMIARAAGLQGDFLGQIRQQQAQFETEMQRQTERIGESDIFGSRMDALDRIAQLSGGFREEYLPSLRAQLDRDSQQAREDAMRRANAEGGNPYGLIAEIEKERLRQQTLLPQTAAGMAGGEIGLLTALLGLGTSAGQQAAELSSQSNLSAAQIAAQQATAAQQARMQNQATQMGGLNQLLGGVGGAMSTVGLMGMLNNQNRPGTTPQNSGLTRSQMFQMDMNTTPVSDPYGLGGNFVA